MFGSETLISANQIHDVGINFPSSDALYVTVMGSIFTGTRFTTVLIVGMILQMVATTLVKENHYFQGNAGSYIRLGLHLQQWKICKKVLF